MKAPEVAVDRVSVDEVKTRMDRGEPLIFLDARNPTAWGEADTKLPGAIRMPVDEVEHRLDELPARDRPIVTYCT